ncbi:hypothetical protein GCM10009416_41910 [Craurococcus roseus]|uniref:Uncharacterized protein n=1 Tax=Craurococcus roseus TaxID=77585 RepID=A0ABP3R193_9PROT
MTARDDLSVSLGAAKRLADKLLDVLGDLAPYLPFDADRVEAAEAANSLLTDAFPKRFENLVNHLQDRLWRRVAVEQGFRDPALMSRRDLADLMEKFGLLESADAFAEMVKTRNRLLHMYPNDPARQATRLNQACEQSAVLLAAADAAQAWAARRLSPPPPASP